MHGCFRFPRPVFSVPAFGAFRSPVLWFSRPVFSVPVSGVL